MLLKGKFCSHKFEIAQKFRPNFLMVLNDTVWKGGLLHSVMENADASLHWLVVVDGGSSPVRGSLYPKDRRFIRSKIHYQKSASG